VQRDLINMTQAWDIEKSRQEWNPGPPEHQKALYPMSYEKSKDQLTEFICDSTVVLHTARISTAKDIASSDK